MRLNRSWHVAGPEIVDQDMLITLNGHSGHCGMLDSRLRWRKVSFSFLEISFLGREDEVPDDDVEMMIIHVWRTDTEGELLGILFGKVRDDHLEPITSEIVVFLTQLVDDLPLDILSHCDELATPTVLTCTLVPHLLWSTCTELDRDNSYYPSSGHYLVIDVTDLTLWDPITRRLEATEELDEEEEEREEGSEEEEENSGAECDDPDYHESEEGELKESESGRLGSSSERSKEEDKAATQRRREKAEGKRLVQESDGRASWLLQGDLARNREPLQEEPGGDGVTTTEGSKSKRRRRSSSQAQSSPPPQSTVHIRGDVGARASSLVVISLSP
ncbi:hypothetical protein CBR_g38448 [Chara braunii]|uniref:Uncharacterized protein n=1 Tax=Chara braunii TaxID=69332 RepID=A0A388JNU1_CHABU|nr:hypothetical protein CBR_g38448 [Chara braunii]|eukprot:GBG59423.1 hypothetical protein CBR_g38448 [Chara braunii]